MTSVIDLGEIGPETFDAGTPRPRRQRWTVRAVTAALAIALGGGVAGAAPAAWLPPVVTISPLLQGPWPPQVVDGALLDVDVARGLMRAHELDGSGLRWTAPLEPGVWPHFIVAEDVVIASMMESTPIGAAESQPLGVRAFDLRTGAELWRVDGSVVTPAFGGVVAVRGTGPWVAGVDTATGAERWRRTWTRKMATVAAPYGVDQPGREVTIALTDGTVETLDATTGQTQRTATVHPATGKHTLEVYAWNDLYAVTYYGEHGPVEFAMYRSGRTLPLWYRPLAQGSGGVWPCSTTTFCVHHELTPVQHVDPYTGVATQAPLETAEEVLNLRDDVLGEVGGHRLVLTRPYGVGTKVWLGRDTGDAVRPLLPLAERLVFCSVQDQWLTCFDDGTPQKAYAVRVADLERLVAELG